MDLSISIFCRFRNRTYEPVEVPCWTIPNDVPSI